MIEYKVKVYEDRTEWLNQNDELYREDGPAVEYSDGSKGWYVNGKLHRLDGPAFKHANGSREWWIDGEYYSEVGFNRKVKELNSPYEGKIVEIDGKKYQLTKI